MVLSDPVPASDAPSNAAVSPRLGEPFLFHESQAAGTSRSVERLPLSASIRSPGSLASGANSTELYGQFGGSTDAAISAVLAPLTCSPSFRVTSIQRWRFLFCDFVFRMGPAIALNLSQKHGTQSLASYQKAGFGLGLTLNLWKRCRRRFDIALYLIQASSLSRIRLFWYWEFDCLRIIPRSAGIMRCVEAGSVDEVQRLFAARRATPRDTTIHGTTLLHVASVTGNAELIRLFIREGGDVNAQDEDGETPLHRAMARKGNYDVARLLIENGADLANNAIDGKTPLHTFFSDTVEKVLLRDDWIEETLPDSEGMSTTHFLAWSSKSTAKLFERGSRHDSTGSWSADIFGRTCLHFAASRGNLSVLEYLLGRANSTDLERTDHEGRTALHYAVQSKRVETIDLLLARGGNLHAKDNSFQTVLHCAAWWENLQAAQKLVALDDSKFLLSPDKNGTMPSQLARGPKATALREFLANIESAAEIGKNPITKNPFRCGGFRIDTKLDAEPSSPSPARIQSSRTSASVLPFGFPEFKTSGKTHATLKFRSSSAAILFAFIILWFLLTWTII